MDLNKQYNNFADQFADSNSNTQKVDNTFSRTTFYKQIDFIKPGIKLIDLACGDAFDLNHYQDLGAEIYGLDASEEMVSLAKKRLPDADIKVGVFESIPFEDNYFDTVLSKYALMTSANLEPVFNEIHRVLKPGGIMMYLVVHPFRQYFEKRNLEADYFKKEVVESHLFGNTMTVNEPSHTMSEYLNDFLFNNYDVLSYEEHFDPAAEAIDGKRYPGFFILKARKK